MRSRLLAGALALAAGVAQAHGRDPEVVTLEESVDGSVTVGVRVEDDPSRVGAAWSFALSPRCRVLDAPTRVPEARGERWRWRVDCGPGGLDGVAVDNLGAAHETVVAVYRRDGSSWARTLRPSLPSLVIPVTTARPSRWATAWSFVALGTAHLATGVDHLLFLALLLVWVKGWRRRALAASAFTLGHAVTLAAATLATAPVSVAWVEALIAGSVWLLAADLCERATDTSAVSASPGAKRRGDPAPAVSTWSPALPLAFGLVHGLGFAEGLRAAGLPPGERALALGAFNVGVELAQLAAVLAVVLMERAVLSRLPLAARAWGERAVVSVAGVAGGWWLTARVVAMVSP